MTFAPTQFPPNPLPLEYATTVPPCAHEFTERVDCGWWMCGECGADLHRCIFCDGLTDLGRNEFGDYECSACFASREETV